MCGAAQARSLAGRASTSNRWGAPSRAGQALGAYYTGLNQTPCIPVNFSNQMFIGIPAIAGPAEGGKTQAPSTPIPVPEISGFGTGRSVLLVNGVGYE
jgi:hypothetical protein